MTSLRSWLIAALAGLTFAPFACGSSQGEPEFRLGDQRTPGDSIADLRDIDPLASNFGVLVRVVGDTDGDDGDDVLATALSVESRTRMRNYLLLGPSAGALTTDGASATFFDDLDGLQEFHPLPATGDIDGDGLADLAFGRFHESESDSAGAPPVRIFLGPVEGDLGPDDADLVFLPEARFHDSRPLMLAVGDFFGDEATDVILLARRDGAVYDFERTVAWGWTGPLEPGTFIPESADYVLTITGEHGVKSAQAAVVGPCRPIDHPKDALVIVHPERIHVPGGVDYSEKLVSVYVWDEGAPRSRSLEDHDGRVRDNAIFTGGRITPVCADFDGDGLDEIVLATGAPREPDGSFQNRGAFGIARITRGEERKALDALVIGEPFDKLGEDFAVVPDLTGDGLPELAVAAPTSVGHGVTPAVHVFASGSPFDLDADLRLVGEPDHLFGNSIAAGDVTGDGVADLVIGAHAREDGRVLVFSGADLRVPVEE